jgi:hypothetical protein
MFKPFSFDFVKDWLARGGMLSADGFAKHSANIRRRREAKEDDASHWERAGGTTEEQNEARFSR